MTQDHPPQPAPHQTAYDPSLVDLTPLREHLAAEHDVDTDDVFIERVEGDRVHYGIGHDR